ncbi:MAG: hypothetical protein ACXVRE_06070 [Gaiellaceae bacterium]
MAMTPAALPPPVLGKTANAAPVSGTTLYRVPGSQTFVTLAEPTQVPLGTELDTTHGRVLLTFATGYGKTEHAQWWQGRFLIGQRKGKKPVGTQTLSGPLVCPARSLARVAAGPKRSLWGKGKGRFRTSGKNASGTVRGTWWLTQDSCAGTLIRVKRGVVDVYDFKKRKHVLVHAGHSYFAKR